MLDDSSGLRRANIALLERTRHLEDKLRRFESATQAATQAASSDADASAARLLARAEAAELLVVSYSERLGAAAMLGCSRGDELKAALAALHRAEARGLAEAAEVAQSALAARLRAVSSELAARALVSPRLCAAEALAREATLRAAHAGAS